MSLGYLDDGPWAYLVHLLLWSGPVIALQLAVLLSWYRRDALKVLRAVGVPIAAVSAWLIAADHLAIEDGIWKFGEGLHLGVRLGAVPLEEVLFFLITNVLVGLGMALFVWHRLRTGPHP